jgi:hypothetical protein
MSRLELTRTLLEHMPEQGRMPLGEVLMLWWYDTRPTGGQRLSWAGYADFVNHLDLDHWSFDFEKQGIPAWIYLKLDRALTAPYYIVDNKKVTSLTVFSSRDSMMINLYGNVEKWIASLE